MGAKRKAGPASIGSLVVRGVLALAALGVIAFAVQGGEWGTIDLIRQTSRLARVKYQVDSLNHEVDSLKKYKQLLLTDPVTQEKIAREEFGMVRGNKEILYRFT
ncbi:MAG: septum formation initiator family protein, partial [Gemmatimonadales bacterium]